MTSVRIACAQIAPAVGDAEGNRRRAHEAVREAIGAGARIVLLPELVASGYVFESAEEARALAQPVDAPALSDWAEEAAGSEAVVVGGFADAGGLVTFVAGWVGFESFLGVTTLKSRAESFRCLGTE